MPPRILQVWRYSRWVGARYNTKFPTSPRGSPAYFTEQSQKRLRRAYEDAIVLTSVKIQESCTDMASLFRGRYNAHCEYQVSVLWELLLS